MINIKKIKNNFEWRKFLKISIIFKIIELLIILGNKNIIYWKILYIFFLINKLIEFPLIIVTYIILIYIYKKINNIDDIKSIILLSTSILLISLVIKEIIKKAIFIPRPYIYIQKHINQNNIPQWIIHQWEKKNNSSFPSGHTIFTSYWIILFWKNKKKIHYIVIFILMILTLSRICLWLHRSNELIFSFIINNISIYIINKIITYINKLIKS